MKTKILLIVFLCTASLTFAQKKLADKFFDRFAYIKANELYLEAYNDGDDSEHVLTRLGDCNYNNSKTEKAAEWYKKALDKYGDDVKAEYVYKYIQTQRSLGNYAEANQYMLMFREMQSDDSRSDEPIDISIYEDLASTEKVYVTLENLDINSAYSDFGAFLHDNTFYFASSRNTDEKVYKWNDQPFLEIYSATLEMKDEKRVFSNTDFINSEDVNTDYHEASVAITKDGKTMYFTRDNVNKRNKLSYDKKGTTHLKIYKATLEDGMWTNIEELPFNDDVFSTGHPALSPTDNQLYFVSDRDGGIGQTDIYVVDINEDGSYSLPRNLGASVNTEGREMFPFVAKDSTLYFSSDGFLNLGLLDIFKSNVLKNDTAEPVNLGAPYNSGYDDFAFFKNDENEEGFFSSNRPDGKGDDDIYGFSAYQCKQTVEGVVRNSETSEPIGGATVQKIDKNGKIIEEFTTSDDGTYQFEVDCDDTYTILGRKEDYKDDLQPLTTTNENEKVHQVDLNLEPLIKDNQIVINPIFFDFDKWNIRTDAQYELENIVDVMRQHPDMVIKIEAHTDSRGSKKYNEKLSDRRAKSTRDYLYSRGIAKERIESAIGYGEYQLLNECADGVKCSEEKHQENRRSYFYILNY